MICNDFLGDKVGRLGFGAMRLPVIDGDQANIDQSQLDQMVDAAFEAGINYFDTAYPYHGNTSEQALGKSLARYPRNSFYLATKYPGHQILSTYDPAVIFEEQLQKCGVEYFDFYLLHNVCENSIDIYTDEKWGIVDYFIEQKRLGRIRHLGFSSHGRPDNLAAFLDYGARKYVELVKCDSKTAALFVGRNVMEFCQIQLNYLDWTLQRASEKCAMLESAGIPVVAMEPLRGGRLVDWQDEQLNVVQADRSNRSPIEWSFRWLQNIANVKVVLSGMSNLNQVHENCGYFAEAAALTQAETAMLADVAETLKGGVPCTACRYCTASCPQQIDIPVMLATYNDLQFASNFTISMQMDAVPEGQRARDCIDCRACSRICPQLINIPEVLSELAGALETMPSWAEMCRQREEAAKKARLRD
ncbi:aldo/keto reductase [Adlercreutzia sp. ZJ154]|uniref:aldo/keto reductase n=1 Tax=Adlercreutzia sp. ZJ154 TaxID=2709790 RepID=UPI0013EB9812|nr:aldo/keto reductase [Adlercreutzia sp. ZJ154]